MADSQTKDGAFFTNQTALSCSYSNKFLVCAFNCSWFLQQELEKKY